MPRQQYTDSFFGFFDKYATQILICVALFVLWLWSKKNTPSEDEQTESADLAESQTELRKLVAPKPPTPTGNKGKDAAATTAYYAKLKETRTATFARELYYAMHRAEGSTGGLNMNLLDGTDEDAIMRVAYNATIQRIPFAALEKSYRAFRAINKNITLTDDLRNELSASDFRKFMRVVGMTPEAAAKESKTSAYPR